MTTALAISLLFGLTVLMAGGLFLQRPDLAWRYARWSNRTRGLTSNERTPEWERANRFNGFFCLISGLVILTGTLIAWVQSASPTLPLAAFDEFAVTCRPDGVELVYRGSRAKRVELEGLQAAPKGLQISHPEWDGRPVVAAPETQGVVPMKAAAKTSLRLAPGETQRIPLNFPAGAQCKGSFTTLVGPADPTRGCEAFEFRQRVVDDETGDVEFDVWRRCVFAPAGR